MWKVVNLVIREKFLFGVDKKIRKRGRQTVSKEHKYIYIHTHITLFKLRFGIA